MTKDLLGELHKHCMMNRHNILLSSQCGCFYCLKLFDPCEIDLWTDIVNDVGQTALCPYCDIDSIIDNVTFNELDESILKALNRRYF